MLMFNNMVMSFYKESRNVLTKKILLTVGH
jgi:hypothetical protein